MIRSFKEVFIVLVSAAMMAIGSQASACVLDCNPNYGDGRTISGNIWGSAGYIGQVGGQNHATGSILDRASLSETGGQTNLVGEVITNTCDSGDCASRAIMNGNGEAFGRSYEFISSDGPGSSSTTQGAAALEIGVRSSIFRQPASQQ